MNIYDKIDAIFNANIDAKPPWVDELFNELQEIKVLLQEEKPLDMPYSKKQFERIDSRFYAFVQSFREEMKANTTYGTYPTFVYGNKRLGVDFKGLLYDKESSKVLSRQEAFKVYRYAYEHQEQMPKIA